MANSSAPRREDRWRLPSNSLRMLGSLSTTCQRYVDCKSHIARVEFRMGLTSRLVDFVTIFVPPPRTPTSTNKCRRQIAAVPPRLGVALGLKHNVVASGVAEKKPHRAEEGASRSKEVKRLILSAKEHPVRRSCWPDEGPRTFRSGRCPTTAMWNAPGLRSLARRS